VEGKVIEPDMGMQVTEEGDILRESIGKSSTKMQGTLFLCRPVITSIPDAGKVLACETRKMEGQSAGKKGPADKTSRPQWGWL